MSPKLRRISIEKRRTAVEDVRKGKKIEKRLVNLVWKRRAFRISANTLGTIRQFETRIKLENYLKIDKALRTALKKSTMKRFEAKTPQILLIDKKKLNIVERIYPCINALDAIKSNKKTARYYSFYQRMLKRNSLSEEKAQSLIKEAYNELLQFLEITKIPFDKAESNVLIEEINPKTRKVSFILIDHGGSICE